MNEPDIARAVDAALAITTHLGLVATSAEVLQNSNKLALLVRPCDTFARVSPVGQEVFATELEIAAHLAKSNSPVALPDPRVETRVYERDGFAISFWKYYLPTSEAITSAAYAETLERLHQGMAQIKMGIPRFTSRVDDALSIVADPARSPGLLDSDRGLLLETLQTTIQVINQLCNAEQLLHGEPHPGNLLNTRDGPLFIDLETCCVGPVEFDLAHVPEQVSALYPHAAEKLLSYCRLLVLAMVAAWRSDVEDQFPDGALFRQELLAAIYCGPPWPPLDLVLVRAGVH